ncbi:PTS sugar transporter subunit IIC [Clostridium hydrogeniformans]|uniref:PTS sugar transporter subunit IIC n=1 Tax=Clostridium hydrogeniformans TaxID=349933 RepID=UPI0004809525|nr:PTS sugar transporter subunit IIC [Clostridium hydrogeniformans]
MEKLMRLMEEKMMPPMAKMAEQKHLRAIRDGIISTLPLILVGCFFLLMINIPITAWKEFIAPYAGDIVLPFRVTMGLMSLYASYGMGYALSKSYKLDGISGGVLSMAAFLSLNIPLNVTDKATDKALGWVLKMEYLGGAGMFTAILSMIIAVEVLRFCKTKNITIKMPDQVPPSVARSFEALIPGAIVITLFWLVRVMFKVDVNEIIKVLFSPLVSVAGNSYLGVLLPTLFICLLWASGVHGVSVIGSLLRPIWLVLLDENMAAAAAGNVAQNIGTEGFFDLFVWIGGSGGTLALCVLFLFSKSAYLKQVGKFSIIPGIFNINEPIIFGAPIVLNPIIAIPFIVGPVINCTITYIAMTLGWVNKVSIMAPWVLPSPIKAAMSTNDWRAAVLVIINFMIALAIYYPFFKMYEKNLLKEEAEQLEAMQAAESN